MSGVCAGMRVCAGGCEVEGVRAGVGYAHVCACAEECVGVG